MKILEFIKEADGKFSSKRLMSFCAVAGVMIDWMHAVWTIGKWSPEWQTVAFIAIVLGYQSAADIFKK